MGQIVALDQNMVNMIAAGEVIERPASVVKELMENSIDAGATQITVAVEDGGRKSISVMDNGCGMDGDDLARAFEPHTTSKIKSSEDLLGISTLGFRGEALASIASISHVRATSRTGKSEQANRIEIDCGDKQPVAPCSGDVGTAIEVRDIFYKLPARRKFLRTANTEMGHIAEQFTRIALGCGVAGQLPSDCPERSRLSQRSDLSLTLLHNGRELHRISAAMPLEQRIGTLFPTLCDNPTQDLIRTQSAEKGTYVLALLGRPTISRTSSKFQYAFLNGRFIRDRFLSHAVREAYRGLMEPNRFPVVFLFIQMPPEDFDVNVHPTKTEVRFFNANLVHSQILGCLREKLLGTNLDVPARLPADAPVSSTGSTSPQREKITDAMAEFFRRHRPSHSQQQFGFPREARHHERPRPQGQREDISSEHPIPPSVHAESRPKFMQIHNSFIVAQTDEGFVIIDQHALHERVIYETLRKRMNADGLESQRLLLPASMELTKSQMATIEGNGALLDRLGIEIIPFGPGTIAIQGFPTLLSEADPIDFVRDLLDVLDTDGTGPESEELIDAVLNMAACKAAIKAGQKLSESEIDHLLAYVESTDCVSRCPHGRPTTIRFSIGELEKQFKRT